MPIFVELEVVQLTETNEPTGVCTDTAYNNDADACYGAGEEFEHDITYSELMKDTTVNLDMVSSFEIGKYLYPDPGGAFAVGDEDITRTMVTVGSSASVKLVNEPLTEFRARMATLY